MVYKSLDLVDKDGPGHAGIVLEEARKQPDRMCHIVRAPRFPDAVHAQLRVPQI